MDLRAELSLLDKEVMKKEPQSTCEPLGDNPCNGILQTEAGLGFLEARSLPIRADHGLGSSAFRLFDSPEGVRLNVQSIYGRPTSLSLRSPIASTQNNVKRRAREP
jgi:hypothetical protein